MSDVYERLADVLDKIPNGFTKIPDGTHLRVLEWIFTPEEAAIAGQMKLMGETLEELGVRIESPVDDLEETLETMAEKGQIRAWDSSTGRRYALIPFAVGIYEEQLDRMDEEFAMLIEEYWRKGRGAGLLDSDPPIFKVIPVNRAIDAELEVYPYEAAEKIVESAKSWGLRECICKKQKELVGEPCDYPTTVCLLMAPKRENAYEDDELTEVITKEEALKLLRDAEEAGLVHCSMNVQHGHYYLCNCCTCCCGILRGLVEHNQPSSFVKSDYVAHVDAELCLGCEACLERCQFDALSVPEDVCEVDMSRCIGCGVCALACPEGALDLAPKPKREKHTPPESVMDWMTQKAISRDVDPSDLL